MDDNNGQKGIDPKLEELQIGENYVSRKLYDRDYLANVPQFGILNPSIEEAAELVVIDMFFNGYFQDKEPKGFRGNPHDQVLLSSLADKIQDFKNRLIAAVELGKLKANPMQLNLEDHVVAEETHVEYSDLVNWLHERGYDIGEIFQDYFDSETDLSIKICDEIIYYRGCQREEGEYAKNHDLIETLEQADKVDKAELQRFIAAYKHVVAYTLSLLEQLRRNRSELLGNVDRPVTTRARRTMLTIIAALCRIARIDFKERGVAKKIQAETEKMGAPVDDETIRKFLVEIPDALETRMK